MWPALSLLLILQLSDWIMELLFVANKRGLHLFSPSNNSDSILSARQTKITIQIIATENFVRRRRIPSSSSIICLCVSTPAGSSLTPAHSLSFLLISDRSSIRHFPLIFAALPSLYLSIPPLSHPFLSLSLG